MQQVLSVWNAIEPRRRIVVVLATLAVFGAVLLLARIASAPSLSLLYSGLEPAAAGEVVQALEQQGVVYEVRGTAIYVDSRARDQLRLTLASQGLPTTGGQGYELLDALSGFGTTAQMFDATYWRAKEGELARTILASPVVQAARVHIAAPSSRPFSRGQRPTASVTITPLGAALPQEHARAFRHLVASAIQGAQLDDVTVIDARSGAVIAGSETASAAGSPEERAEALRRNVERLLAARVGPGAAVVEVAVETVTDVEQITERRLDPDARVAISSDNEERSKSATDERSGAVTVASNLPEGDAGGTGATSSSQDSETRERVNYDVSETRREVTRQPGAIRRLTVAVLVDGIRGTAADGQPTWQPRPDEELATMRDLVASAVGFDESRGDVITVRSMELREMPADVPAEQGGFAADLDLMTLIQVGVLALVALVLGLFVVRPVLTSAVSVAALPPPVGAAAGAAAALPSPGAGPLTGEIADDGFEMPTMAVVSDFDGNRGAMLSAASGDAVQRLRALISDRQEETVEILRSWMEQPEETT